MTKLSTGDLDEVLDQLQDLSDNFGLNEDPKTFDYTNINDVKLPLTTRHYRCLYNSLINALRRSGEYDAAWQLWEMMKQRQVSPNHSTFLYLLDLCWRHGHPERIDLIWQEMEQFGVEPQETIYTAAIEASLRCSKVDKAFKYYSKLEKKVKAPSLRTIAIIATLLSSTNALREKSLSLLYDTRYDKKHFSARSTPPTIRKLHDLIQDVKRFNLMVDH